MVDLAPSSEEIQDLILTRVLESDSKKLPSQHLSLQKQKRLLQETLFKDQVTVIYRRIER